MAGKARRAHRRNRGMALPSALMLASMMLTTSAVWLEASIAQTRLSAGVHEHLRATQAADVALALCVDALHAGVAPVLPEASAAWIGEETFEGPSAYQPVSSWPGSASAPRCVIEALRVKGRADVDVEEGSGSGSGAGVGAGAYRITALGFGATRVAQARLQRTLWREGGRERSAWRRIVASGVFE